MPGKYVVNTHNYELIIVDNASGAETKKYLADRQAKLGFTLITNDKNMGFSYGNNQAIKVASCDYICFLNSDTVVTYGWLGKLMEGLKLPEAGAVGPSSCWTHGKQCWILKRLQGLGSATYIAALKRPRDYSEFNTLIIVGFCVLVKREVVEKIGGFDHHSNFRWPWVVDVDFQCVLLTGRIRLYWIKDCYIHHYGAQTYLSTGINLQKLGQDTRPALKEIGQ